MGFTSAAPPIYGAGILFRARLARHVRRIDQAPQAGHQ
jgi:hypothetical protein